jgi:hypothetical protein
MAFTETEETKLREIITAYDEGQQVDDLPAADTSTLDKTVEVFDNVTGTSQQMGLREAVDMANTPWCARKWKKGNASSKAAGWAGSLELLRTLPSVLGLGCYLVKNDHSRTKLDPNNHYLFANGAPAKLDGSMGHYQWGSGVPFYVSLWEEGDYEYEAISLYPIKGHYCYRIPVFSGSASGHAAMDRTNNILVSYINDDAQYRGGNNTSSWDETNRTLLGRCVTNISTATAAAAAHKNGSGWLAGSFRTSAIIAILFEIIFGERNVQAAYNPEKDADGLYQGGFGTGVTTFSSWGTYNSYNPFLHMSAGVELGDNCGLSSVAVLNDDGSTAYTASVPCFFGLKNFFGYIWRENEDEIAEANEDKTMNHWLTPSIYGTYTYGSTTGMVKTNGVAPVGAGYIKARSMDSLECYPTQTGGSETTYFADYLWNSSGITSGLRAVFRGATANNGGHAGVSTVIVNAAPSGADADVGVPLCEFAEEWPVEPEYYAAA